MNMTFKFNGGINSIEIFISDSRHWAMNGIPFKIVGIMLFENLSFLLCKMPKAVFALYASHNRLNPQFWQMEIKKITIELIYCIQFIF